MFSALFGQPVAALLVPPVVAVELSPALSALLLSPPLPPPPPLLPPVPLVLAASELELLPHALPSSNEPKATTRVSASTLRNFAIEPTVSKGHPDQAPRHTSTKIDTLRNWRSKVTFQCDEASAIGPLTSRFIENGPRGPEAGRADAWAGAWAGAREGRLRG